MTKIRTELTRRIARLAADRESGASEILLEVLAILGEGLAAGVDVEPLAAALCEAQPTMAPVWNAAIEAVASTRQPGRLDRFAARVRRAPAALSRVGMAAFELPAGAGSRPGTHPPLRLATYSYSGSVAAVLEALHAARPLHVACSEGRPALEGRRLAARLAAGGIPVTLFADGAIGHALASAEAVLVGADAVGPEWFLNKSGTRMLAAAAAQQGVPVHVVASRDKFVSPALAARVALREGAAAEIWDAPPPGVEVCNPYFEATPLDLVATIISDAGVLGSGMVPDVCEAVHDAVALQALELIGPG